jgi:hypothetical protein
MLELKLIFRHGKLRLKNFPQAVALPLTGYVLQRQANPKKEAT